MVCFQQQTGCLQAFRNGRRLMIMRLGIDFRMTMYYTTLMSVLVGFSKLTHPYA
jgi:hypothetical protein